MSPGSSIRSPHPGPPRDSPRGNCPQGSCPQGSCPRGSCPRGSCPITDLDPAPIVTFYSQQGLLRAYSSPVSSIRSPHPGPPRDSYRVVAPGVVAPRVVVPRVVVLGVVVPGVVVLSLTWTQHLLSPFTVSRGY